MLGPVRDQAFALIILNQEIDQSSFSSLYDSAKLRLCADGGARRLISWCQRNGKDAAKHIPDYVVGDLDSIDKETKEWLRAKGAQVILDRDQNATDFEKCCSFISSLSGYSDTPFIVVGAMGGRFDHTMMAINVLYKNASRRIVLASEASLAWLIRPASFDAVDLGGVGSICGLLPVGHACRVSTTGLEWNLEDEVLAFGGLISTSNVVKEERVTIQSDRPLIWTVENRGAAGTF